MSPYKKTKLKKLMIKAGFPFCYRKGNMPMFCKSCIDWYILRNKNKLFIRNL